jgi:membrane protein
MTKANSSPISPLLIPKWIKPVLHLKARMNEDYMGLIAAGVAFYFFLAAFPALGALISLYGLFSDPVFITNHLNMLSQILPAEALDIFAVQARELVLSSEKVLSFSLIASVFLALFSATQGVKALIKGFNIANDQKEKRNFFSLNFIAFSLTIIMMAYFTLALGAIAVIPVIIHHAHLTFTGDVVVWLRWPLLFLSAILGLDILYYFGPSHRNHPWKWISWGAFIAALLWLLFSSLFALFVSHFAQYNKVYGSLGAVVILLLWFWLSALIILAGAEINALNEKRNS